MASIIGTIGNDFIYVAGDGHVPPPIGSTVFDTATDLADTISSGGGGGDRIFAGGGNDVITFGSDFETFDKVDGGLGTNDVLDITGLLSITLEGNTITGIETLRIGANNNAFAHSLVMHDGNVAAGEYLLIDGLRTVTLESVTLDFSQETDAAAISYNGGGGDDTVIGRAGGFNDQIVFYGGGADSFSGVGLGSVPK